MNKVIACLWRSWFDSAPARRLAVLRVLIGSYALWYVYTRWDLLCKLARQSGRLWNPVGVMRVLGDPMDPVAADWLFATTIIVGVLFVLGVFFRYSGPAFAVLLLATLCYRNSWSMIYHMHNLLVLHVIILGFVRSADAFSIDAWRFGRRAVWVGKSRSCGWEFGWPIKLFWSITAVGYFLAGFAKVMGPTGWMWASGQSMRSHIAVDSIRKVVLEDVGMDVAFVLYDQVWLFTLLGIATYLLELGAPMFLANKHAVRIWALGTFAMHWGIFFIMGIKFRYQLAFIMFLPYFEVEWIADRCSHAGRRLVGSMVKLGFWSPFVRSTRSAVSAVSAGRQLETKTFTRQSG